MRATMNQERLNHLMVLHVHKSEADSLNLVEIANTFVNSEHRRKLLGTFTCDDLANKSWPVKCQKAVVFM